MKKEDAEMIEKILESGQVGYAYFYPLDNNPREVYLITTTPENMANYLGNHSYDAKEIIITDMVDRLILKTYGGFIEHCPDQKLCRKIVDILAPIQSGQREVGEILQIDRNIADIYFAEEDAEVTMAEMAMG